MNAEIIIALCALVIASVTSAVSIYQSYLNRKHNRLSVKPYLTISSNNDDTGKLYTCRFNLINNGLGPAIIKDFSVFYEGKKIGSSDDSQALENAIQNKISEVLKTTHKTVGVFGKDYTFPSGDRFTLLKIAVPQDKNSDKKLCQDFLEKCAASLKYESMYGEKFTYDTRDDKDS